MDKYAAAWHIQWLKGTLSGKHPKSFTGYVQALKLRFEDKNANGEAYADLEKVRYEGCIQDMFTQIHTYNDKAMVTGPAFKKLILDRLPPKILEQMHTIDLSGKTDDEIITIITNARKTAEKWEAAKKSLGLRKTVSDNRNEFSKRRPFEKTERTRFEKPREFKNKPKFQRKDDKFSGGKFKFRNNNISNKSYAEQTDGIDKSELDRRKAAGECQRCAWPGDRKGAHKTMDCYRWKRVEKGTAPFSKPKAYQQLKVRAYDQEEDPIDLYTTDEEDSGNEEEDSGSEDSGSEEEDSGSEDSGSEEECLEEDSGQDQDHEEAEDPKGNWRESGPGSDSEE